MYELHLYILSDVLCDTQRKSQFQAVAVPVTDNAQGAQISAQELVKVGLVHIYFPCVLLFRILMLVLIA